MSHRNLRGIVYALEVTNLSNPLKFMQLGFVHRLGCHRDRRRWLRWPVGYEKWFRNSLTDKQIFGLLFDGLPRFTGD